MKVVAHEFGHVVYLNLSAKDRQDYQLSLKWTKLKQGVAQMRPGEFISSRASDSIDEDFAENFSYQLFEPQALKSKVPKASAWFEQKFSGALKLDEDCKHEKN